MKHLWLVRHAKSSWDDAALTDFERPLNARGKKAAPDMARRLAALKPGIQRIVTSPARRALDTAKLLAEELEYPLAMLAIEPRIYEAAPRTLLEIIASQPDDRDVVMLVGHNPGMHELINRLAPEPVERVPTCTVAGLEFNAKRWADIPGLHARKLHFDYPRKGQPDDGEADK